MTKLTTKQKLAIYAQYMRVISTQGLPCIADVYGRYSPAKAAAESDILAEIDAINADTETTSYACCYAVISHNSNFFTAGYRIYTPDENDPLIEHETFVYHTAHRKEVIEIS